MAYVKKANKKATPIKTITKCPDREHPKDITDPTFNLCKNPKNKTGSVLCNWTLTNNKCPRGYKRGS